MPGTYLWIWAECAATANIHRPTLFSGSKSRGNPENGWKITTIVLAVSVVFIAICFVGSCVHEPVKMRVIHMLKSNTSDTRSDLTTQAAVTQEATWTTTIAARTEYSSWEGWKTIRECGDDTLWQLQVITKCRPGTRRAIRTKYSRYSTAECAKGR